MAVGMPPAQPVEYRIERPAAVQDHGVSQISQAIAQARKSIASRSASASGETVDKMLPPLDMGSKAMSMPDRKALVTEIEAPFGADRAKTAAAAPHSYVGDRIRVAAMQAQMMDRFEQGRLVAEEAHVVRCRTIALAMDRRAGAYVLGGEQAAQTARRSISQQSLDDCREAVVAQRTKERAPTALAAVRVDPRQAEQGRARVDPVAYHPKPVEVDPKARQTPPVRINPIARQIPQVHLDI